ncbi:MAG: class I SAM-dependent methyltransferase [Bacteroidetes bacterium]|nr:class I SAM-dependent methyltransferase [Bacteroidota bacterium]
MAKWTGERLETHIHNFNTAEHLHRYALTLSLVYGKKVIDIASGEGYGSNLLSSTAAEVVGVDIDSKSIEEAQKKYSKKNLSYKVGSATAIPYPDNYFDIAVSFETIEHHDQHQEMMLELKRVLKEEGLLIISSPDKLYYTDKRGERNPFHIKELYANEFEALLKNHFRKIKIVRQKSFFGSFIYTEGTSEGIQIYSGDYDRLQSSDEMGALYLIAIASDGPLPIIGSSIFDGEKVLEQMLKDKVEEVKRYRSFIVGEIILKPFRQIKKYIASFGFNI